MSDDITKAIHHADRSGGASLPAIVGIIYGIVYYFEYNSIVIALILSIGGVVSIICIQAMMWVFYSPPGRSWALAAAAFSTLIPWAYSLFLICFLGLWNGWFAITRYHGVGAAIAAIFWVLVGWRMLYMLGRISRKE